MLNVKMPFVTRLRLVFFNIPNADIPNVIILNVGARIQWQQIFLHLKKWSPGTSWE
jgi:hypothetical protein